MSEVVALSLCVLWGLMLMELEIVGVCMQKMEEKNYQRDAGYIYSLRGLEL